MVREIFLFVPSKSPLDIKLPIPLPTLLPFFTFPWIYISVFDSSSLFSGPQRCPFLISSLLFYSFFHFRCHLFCLTLTVYPESLSSPPFAFLQALCCCTPPHPTPSPFHPNCSFLWTLQLCCPAFRRCEYLQFCMFKNLWWARDSHHCSCIYVCASEWMHAHGFLC